MKDAGRCRGSAVDSVSDCDYSFVTMHHRRSITRRVIWCLLVAWLLLGGVAFIEQTSSVPETSTQDEQALSQLGLTLKPEIGTVSTQVSSSATTTVMAPLIVLTMPPLPYSSITALDPALRPHQRVSVYRI